MRHGFRAAFLGALTVVLVVVFASSTVAGQASSAGVNTPAAGATYKAPRTPDGQPDLQGVWANNDATPLQRPTELAGRQFLTEAEVASLKRRAAELFNGETDAAFGDSVFLAAIKEVGEFTSRDKGTGNYNHFWIVDREFDNRTSIISDPTDGRIPPLTPAGTKRKAALDERRKMHPADGPEDLPLSHRCVTFGVPRLGAGYNSYFQIVQNKDYVAIAQEMIHDVRLIPLDNRPHLPSDVGQWHGDSRARWDDDTLVVETKNFSSKSQFRRLPAENLHTVERFTRIGPKTIRWEVTVNDPTTWTKPWTATVMLRHTTDQIYEMACHEGNEGLPGALSGYRAQERKAQLAEKNGSK
jgi:hypothetical protein